MTGNNPGSPEDNGNGGDDPSPKKHEIIAAVDSLTEQYKASQQERSEHDRKVFLWTKRATIGVGIYTLLTLLGVVITYFALQKAEDSIVVARHAERIANRAYVTSTAFQLIHYGEKTPSGHIQWELSPIIENSGNTSARFLNLKAGIGPGPGPTWTFEMAMANLADTQVMLAPKTQVTLPSKFLYWLGVPSAMFPVLSFGTAKYRDVFGDPHITRFCYSFLLDQPIDWDNYPVGQSIHVPGVAAPQCAKHNCEDEECGPDWEKLATE